MRSFWIGDRERKTRDDKLFLVTVGTCLPTKRQRFVAAFNLIRLRVSLFHSSKKKRKRTLRYSLTADRTCASSSFFVFFSFSP